ncbi:MAG TPA: TetR/AcrR family transcriptional regulator [Spirochaetota bacterium]|nr:TetR/AcrR family transcriptional regulator [Spirochaetota bacterium]HOK91884.1 TetR/AcrR family transcriptional regulator [Spirochaetota bacterium]HPP95409.1 TetR/AcrR family transcriptional regulator [Spirochaetota bacterium]HRS62333.1 TetR/AcrR family transcriptional regulator [Spirochaetota bacterium]HRU65755.1 TetR/AcrR family transcriptional regulator [Spirochaetota bacterium]
MSRSEATTEDKILNGALDEFAELGFDGARVDRIAARSGLNKAMIYYYFKSKENLYETIVKNIASIIQSSIIELASNVDGEPLDKFYLLIERYIDIVSVIDRRYLRIMMRELASGGSFFKKIVLPTVIVPVMTLVESIFKAEIASGRIRELNPYLTQIQIIGSIVFFNIIRIPLEDSPLRDIIFKDDYIEAFKSNMLSIIKQGIEKKEASL